MSNFTISWKLENFGKAGRSWKLERAGKFWGEVARGELEIFGVVASWDELEPSGELEKFVKFYTSWKFAQVKYMYKYFTSWKLDKLEPLTARQAGNFKIIKFFFINKFLFLFNFKN